MLTLSRQTLFEALQRIMGGVDQRSLAPILSHVLLEAEGSMLSLTTTNTYIELISYAELVEPISEKIRMTLQARKLADICRTLPPNSRIQLTSDENWGTIQSEHCHFKLAALPADDFPKLTFQSNAKAFKMSQHALLNGLMCTHFSLAEKDVRYFLNGIGMQFEGSSLRCIAMDGHRLAIDVMTDLTSFSMEMRDTSDQQERYKDFQIILPRKASAELIRLLQPNDTQIELLITQNHIRVQSEHFSLTSHLIAGDYLNYKQFLPTETRHHLPLNVEIFKLALTRIAILTSEKFRGVRLTLSAGQMCISTHTAEQEQAEEQMTISYAGPALDLCFNVQYLLDVLNVVRSEQIDLGFNDAEDTVLLKEIDGSKESLFAIMPLTI